VSHSNSTIRGLFVSDITRDIPPVVYFHEQSPDKLAAEVSEYIITGGHEVSSADHRRVPRGIHDEYVQLLETIAADRAAKTDLPAAWVSGFYGSGKSSFAKLLGLALDGLRAPAGPIRLPDGRALHEAWLARDLTARAEQLHTAWQRLIADLRDPIAVVFDLGATARDREHVHAVCVRQLQAKLGYCPEPLVAEFELRIENAGEWARFDALAREQLGKPWAEAARRPFAEEEFSALMARMYPDRYRDPMSWFSARGGTQSSAGSGSPEQAVQMILDMLAHRRPHAEVFFVIDEVSQYIHTSQDRVDRLRAFATAFGAASRGKHWIIAIGQQKLDEDAGESWLAWAKDRFPARLRVHLATNNIRDVVHRRLLQKTPAGAERLRELYARHRPELQLSGYGSAGLGADAFAEVYPLLPDHVDLIMRITSAMRLRSRRTQGDDAAIRGLLQALGELFRSQHFAEREVGELVTLEHLYEIQHTSLDADVQNAMARIHTHCANQPKQAGAAMLRAAKAVALLELIQDVTPTEETLVAQCLYARLGAGSNLPEVHDALEALRAARLLSYSEKLGYGIQSLAGEDWLRERDEYDPASDEISRRIHDELAFLLGSTPAAKLEGRAFPWSAHFSDELRADDVSLVSVRDHGSFELDFRLRRHDHDGDAAKHEEHAAWLRRSSESLFVHRLVWVVGARKALDDIVVDALRTTTMVRKYKSRVGSLPAPRQRLFFEEESREMELTEKVREAVAAAWMDGHMYLRGRAISPSSLAKEFKSALSTAAQRLLPELYPHFVAVTLTAGEFAPLLAADPSGISPKLTEGLGIFEKEGKRYVPACKGVVPGRIAEFLRSERHPPSGAVLLAHFGGPPFGYTAEVIKACVAGLLRAGRIRIALEGVGEITAIRDAGVHDLFEKDRDFKRATIAVVGKDDEIGFSTRARICKVIEPMHAHETTLEREDHAIADAVTRVFPGLASRTRALLERLQRLPTLGKSKLDPVLVEFEQVVNTALRSSRQTKATLLVLKQGIDTLSSGHELLARLDAQVTDARVDELRASHELLVHQLAQLDELHGRQPLVDMPAIAAAGAALREGLAAARPWEFELQLRGPAEFLRRRYVDERRRLLAWQQARVESVRAELQQREGFAALPAAKAHDVIRPIIAALHDTTDDAIAPTLLVLADTFTVTLDERSKDAQRRLDQLLSEALAAPIRTLELHLRDREVGSEAEVEALLAELRERLLDQIRSGVRVRLT
jgi:hypothetical protein